MKKVEKEFLELVNERYGQFLVQQKKSTEQVEVISTGSLALDISTGIGGIPRGKITTLYGPESSGKTTLSLSIANQARKLNLKTLYIDPENGLDYDYVQALVGTTDPEYLVILQPEFAEDAFEIAEAGISSGEFGLVVFDSVGALAPRKVKEGEFSDAHVALVARMVGQFLSRNIFQIRENNLAFLFVNQVRAKINAYVGGYETPGGFALKHDSSMVIFLSKSEEIKQGQDSIGIITRFVIKKNKLASPFKTNYIPIIFGTGVDYYRDVVSFAEFIGVMPKRGSYYTFEGETVGQGMMKTVETLKEKPETLDKIVETCYNSLVKKILVTDEGI